MADAAFESGNRVAVRCTVIRGGTTRGFFFCRDELPADPQVRDELLLDIVAGRSSVQADGLGGVDMLLGKVVIVWPSERADVDVECVFGVITPGSRRIKYGTNCGNLLAGVALFAREQGFCRGAAVRVRNADTGGLACARLRDGLDARQRQLGVMGVAATGRLVELAFARPACTIGRGLLPTGRSRDQIVLDAGRAVDISLVDAGALYLFVQAEDLQLDYATQPLDGRCAERLLATVETLRGHAAKLCGLIDHAEEARSCSPLAPKVAIVSPPRTYTVRSAVGIPERRIDAASVDVLARIVSGQQLHGSCAVTGAIAMAAAAVIPGTVVQQASVGASQRSPLTLRIGHVAGVIEPGIDWQARGDAVSIDHAYMLRSARTLMRGVCYGPV